MIVTEDLLDGHILFARIGTRFKRCWQWIRQHKLITAWVMVLAGLAIRAIPDAAADPGTGGGKGEGNPYIAWMGIKDSDGAPIAKYTLTLNQGNIADPVTKAFAWLDSALYEFYKCITASALWLIKFVLEFTWLTWLSRPFQMIGKAVNEAVTRYGIASVALAVMALIVVWAMLSNRIARAFSNLMVGLLMVGLAATVFANPLAELVGPDGLLASGRDKGLEIAVSMSGGTVAKQGDKLNVDDMISQLADRFLRAPTQAINFGQGVDSISRACQKAWTDGINNGHGDTLKDDVWKCDKKAGDRMHDVSMSNPAGMLVGILMASGLAVFLVVFACYFVWHIVRAAVHAMTFAVLASLAFALAAIPGGPQTFAWRTVLDCAIAYIAMVIYTALFGGYNVVLDSVYKQASNPIQSLFYTALFLVLGLAVLGPIRKMLDRGRDTAAAKLGNASVSSGGKSWLSRAADMAQIKNALPKRSPKRVDDNPPNNPPVQASSTSTSPAEDASTDSSVGASVADSDAASTSTGSSSTDSAGSATTTPSASPHTSQVSYISRESAAAAHDRLAEAMRIQRGFRTRGGPAPTPGSGAPRHAMVEAA